MLAKYWKKIGLIVVIIACVFNVLIKLINKLSLDKEMLSSAQYVYEKDQEENKEQNKEQETQEQEDKQQEEKEEKSKKTEKNKSQKKIVRQEDDDE